MSRRHVFALIAGGGTGGHVVPALAIGRALVARGHRSADVHFVGSRRGIEAKMVPAAGFGLTVLPGRGIVRRVSMANVGAIAGLALGSLQALDVLRRLRPAVVVSVGGYASVPCVLAAAAWRVPLVVAEQNSVPGAANRLASRLGAVAAVSFPNTALPRATLTGNPVRAEILAVDRSHAGRAAARRQLGLPPEALIVGVATGSLGARSVNRAVLDLARCWEGRRDVALYHVTGERDWAEMSAGAPGAGALAYRQVRFEQRMELLYAAADVMVGRAGASSVAELLVAAVPSVLIPLPGAPGDHQSANAQRLGSAGAAVVVADADCDARRLAEVLEGLLGDSVQRARMAEACKSLAHPEAAAAVAQLVERQAATRASR